IIQPIRVDVQRIAMSISCTYGYSHNALTGKKNGFPDCLQGATSDKKSCLVRQRIGGRRFPQVADLRL
ncbi:MAG: hypothetical protein LBS16_07190, partial [Prevotellaceae bacterium]|nr:hypothetical protein [Prevotellaceae bacterium]